MLRGRGRAVASFSKAVSRAAGRSGGLTLWSTRLVTELMKLVPDSGTFPEDALSSWVQNSMCVFPPRVITGEWLGPFFFQMVVLFVG